MESRSRLPEVRVGVRPGTPFEDLAQLSRSSGNEQDPNRAHATKAELAALEERLSKL